MDDEKFVTTQEATNTNCVEKSHTWDHLLKSSFVRKKHYYEEELQDLPDSHKTPVSILLLMPPQVSDTNIKTLSQLYAYHSYPYNSQLAPWKL